jgi:hypothetical protein
MSRGDGKLQILKLPRQKKMPNFINQLMAIVHGLIHIVFEVKLKQVILPHKN